MSGTDVAAISNAVFRHFELGAKKTTFDKFGFLKRVKKVTDLPINEFEWVQQTGVATGIGPTVASAQSHKSSTKFVKWRATGFEGNAEASVSTRVMFGGKPNRAAAVDLWMTEVDGIKEGINRRIEIHSLGSGYGDVAQLASTSSISSATATLKNKAMAKRLQPGDTVVMAHTQSGAVYAGNLVVLKTNELAGTVTFTQNVLTGIPSAVDGDYIFFEDEAYNNDSQKVISGLKAWIANDGTTSLGTFLNVDRSVYPLQTAGQKYDLTKSDMNQAISFMVGRAREYSNEENPVRLVAFVSANDWQRIVDEAGSRVRTAVGEGKIGGAKSLTYISDQGDIEIVALQYNLDGDIFMLNMTDWELKSMGNLPQILTPPGGMLYQAADQWACRIWWCAELICKNPAAQIYGINFGQ